VEEAKLIHKKIKYLERDMQIRKPAEVVQYILEKF
jgi:hypothetical protein